MNKYLLLITFVASLGGLLFGFDIAIISGAVPFIQRHFELNELQLGWGVSSLLFGCMVGSAAAGKMTDQYGRKKILIYVAVLFAVTSAMTALAPDFNFFIISRILGGIAVGAASFLSPLYISEIAPASRRGMLVSCYQLSIVVGIVLSYLINYLLHDIGNDNWRWMFATGILPSVLFFVLLFLVPETPRWLFQKNRKEEALLVLKDITGTDGISEFENLNTVKTSVNTPLFQGKNKKIMFTGMALAFFIQFSGINTIVDYAPIILKSAGWKIDAALFSTFIIGFINLIFTIISLFIIDKIGRKKLYLVGSLGMGCILAYFSISYMMGTFTGNIVLVLILAYIALFAVCVGTVFWTLLSEIFPSSIRGRAMSVATLTNWFANALIVFFFPYFIQKIGGAFTFGFLASMCFLMMIFTWFFIKETKGKSLEEIEIGH